jgi:hypothetical protein
VDVVERYHAASIIVPVQQPAPQTQQLDVFLQENMGNRYLACGFSIESFFFQHYSGCREAVSACSMAEDESWRRRSF